MKAILRTVLLISLLSLLVKCNKDEVTGRDYPRIKTLPVTEITPDGARFNAEILFRGDFEIINYGFVWSEYINPVIQNSDRVVYTDNIVSENFSEIIETTLKENVSYFVRAFVETKDFIVYGENIQFLSLGSKAPKILDVFPLAGTTGDTLTIKGENFSYVNQNNEFFFNNSKTTAFECSDSLILVVVPEITNPNSIISISVAGNSAAFPDPFITTTPLIYSVHPALASFTDTIEINGDCFSYVSEANQVFLGDTKASVITSSKKRLQITVPGDLEKSVNKLRILVGGREAVFESVVIKPPVIFSINSDLIQTFDVENMTITGENFNPLPQKNNVSFGEHQAKIVSSTSTQLVVEFPRSLIPIREVSVSETLDVTVRILDQSFTLEEALTIDYKSRWTKMRDFPGNPRIYGAYFSIGGYGYIGLGGGNEFGSRYKDFWEYDPITDIWIRLEDFPGDARNKFATFVIGEKAYIICGTKDNQYTPSYNLSEVWEFNGITRTWTQKNDFPGGARFSPFGFSIGNYGYAGGGVYGNYEEKKDFWKYDPVTDTWSRLNDIYDGIWSEDVLTISSSNTAHILAKYYGSYGGSRYFWEYDEVNDSWTQLSHCPIGSREMSGFRINNKIYAGLGLFSSFYGTNVWIDYDIASNTWHYGEDVFAGGYRRNASSFTIGNTGYILLGMSGSHYANKNDVWKFDPSKPD